MYIKRDSNFSDDSSDKSYVKNDFESSFQYPSEDDEFIICSYNYLASSFTYIGVFDFLSFYVYFFMLGIYYILLKFSSI